jgi:hypothetical protein
VSACCEPADHHLLTMSVLCCGGVSGCARCRLFPVSKIASNFHEAHFYAGAVDLALYRVHLVERGDVAPAKLGGGAQVRY